MNVANELNVVSSLLLSTIALWRGTNADPAVFRPKKKLELFDIEGCPFCRLVREALTELDLQAKIYPCPKGGKRFRPQVKKMGRKYQFPFLVDPNKDVQMYESYDIIQYLFSTYGKKSVPLKWRPQMINKTSAILASLVRPGLGLKVQASRRPKKFLELYSFESSPYSRLVREILCELEIPYLLHNVGKIEAADFILPSIRSKILSKAPIHGSSRQAFVERSGKMMVPYLIDPNTDTEMFESAEIKKYLLNTYAD